MPEPIILILDDEPNELFLAQGILRNSGYQTLTADLPYQALALLEHHSVDAMLVDVRMPGMDVFHLINQVREKCPELALILMTGFSSLEMAMVAQRNGADALILKPIQEKELVETVARAIENSSLCQDGIRLRALQPVYKAVESLIPKMDPVELRDRLVDSVYSLFNCSFTAHFFIDKSGSIKILAQRGQAPKIESYLKSTCAFQTSQDISPHWFFREAISNSLYASFLMEAGLADFLCVPLKLHPDPCSGVLIAARSQEQGRFSETDVEGLSILSRHAALALENAQLYADLDQSLKDLERSQNAMVQVKKMATVGRLTASIAHEINNPLQGLQNWLQLAGRQELASSERQRYLELAQGELTRLTTTVQGMLDFYRPRLRDKRLVDLNELVKYVIFLLESQLQNSRVDICLSLHQQLPAVNAVGSQIQQVLLNLLINAMDAMPDGGSIRIQTQPVSIKNGSVNANSAVEVLISDTGPGIPKTVRDQLFEPFVSTKESGTGLGLSMCYGIITAHGGTLELLPDEGSGACFRIIIPEEKA